jgi:thioredoxin 1
MPTGISTSLGMQASSYPLPILPSAEAAALTAAKGVTLIDFTAKWCGPCKQLAPILAGLATEYGSQVRVVAVDVDDSQDVAQRYGVRAMPTMVLLRDGAEVGRVVGTRSRAFLAGVLDRALAGDVAIASP